MGCFLKETLQCHSEGVRVADGRNVGKGHLRCAQVKVHALAHTEHHRVKRK